MIISSIKLKNFLVHEDSEIYFDRGLNVITGKNGSGKSSIVQAIYYVLFGKALYYSSAREFIRYNQRDFFIEIEVVEGNRKILISRGKDASSFHSNVLYINSSNALKDYLYRNYNANAKRYESTLLVKQGSIDEFISSSPSVRMKEFEKIIGVDVLKKILEANEILIKELEGELKGFDYEGKMQELNNKKNEVKRLEEENEKKFNEKISIESEIKQLEKDKELLKKIRELYQKLKEIELKEEELDQLNLFLESNKEKYQKYIRYNRMYKAAFNVKSAFDEFNRLMQELEDLEKIRLAYENYELYLKWSEKEEIKKLESDYERGRELGDRIEKVFGVRNGVDEVIKHLKEKKYKLLAEKESLDKKIGEIENEIKQNKKILGELEIVKGLCPLCKQPIDEEHKKILLEEANLKIKELNNKRIDFEEERLKIDKELKDIEGKLAMEELVEEYLNIKKTFNLELWKEWNAIKEFNTPNNKRAYERFLEKSRIEKEIAEIKALIDSWDKSIDCNEVIKFVEENKEFYEEYIKKLGEVENIKSEISKKNEIIKEIESFGYNFTELENVDESISQKERQITEKWKILGEIEKHIKKNDELIMKYKEDISKLEKEIKNYQNRKENKSFYEELSNRLERLINYERKRYYEKLKFIVKHYFDNFGLSDYENVELEFNEDRLNLYLIDESGNRYEARYLSGGERTAFSLSFRLAIAQMLDIKFKILILDEPTEGMDDIRISSLKELFIYFISKNPDYQVIIITHEEELSDIANRRIYLERLNNRSIVYAL